MQCPFCSHAQHRVIDTRDTGESIRRRRQCRNCDQRFTTYENVSANLLVVKSDGRREPFDRQKLLTGIQIAATKRPIALESMNQMVGEVEDGLQATGRPEIDSKAIGRLVLDRLAEVDQVAYIRFASVYLDLSDIAKLKELRQEIDRLIGR